MNLSTVLTAVWLYLPAYFANAAPVALGGGPPLDGGEKWLDGKPFLGSHKTFRGCVVGIVAGLMVGVLQGSLYSGLAQGFGAIFGDLLSSFLKRRWGLAPGEGFPLLDQLDFIIVAIILSQPYTRASLQEMLIILIVTVPIHYFMNFVAWVVKLKENPW
jgi:CDP-2,3-bis-(O-geranylgeranyl)-sn-glycerol synthase